MKAMQDVRHRFEQIAYPELARIAPQHRDRALERARSESFDLIELIGLALGLVLVTALTRYALKDPGLTERLVAALLNCAVALPLLVVLCGPFQVRRMRRGLRAFVAEQGRRT